MIVTYNLKSKVAGSIALALFICLGVAIAMTFPDPSPTWQVARQLIGAACSVALIAALWLHLKAKARSGAWLLLLVFNIIGIAIILALRDRSATPHG